jgi:HK97 gp10 family phage protein
MAAETKIDIIGAKELMAVMNELPDKLNVGLLRNINKVGAKEFKEEMKSNVPVGSDGIFNAIKIQNDKSDKTGVLVGVGGVAFWARFLEFGTQIRKTKGGGPIQFKQASRGVMKPEPFLAMAIERVHPRALKAIFDNMGLTVTKFLKSNLRKINKKK